jgi:hypothetical protein
MSSPLGESRGGTPEGVLPPQGQRRTRLVRWLRNSAFRRSASFFLSFFVARMERSEIRERHASWTVHPDYAALHPGYVSTFPRPIETNPAATAGKV